MLYIFHGSDIQKSRAKARSVVEVLQKKKPDASVFAIEPEGWSQAQFEELVGGRGLFVAKYIVVLDGVFENEEAKEFILDVLPEMQEAEHIFVMREGKVDKPTLKKLEKYAEKTQELTASEKKKEFNIFALADSFAARDTKKAWGKLLEAQEHERLENIHGALFFQVKALLLAKTCKSAKEAGLNPFPYQKAKKHAGKFTEEELRLFSRNLVSLYHDAHRGKVDLGIGLEQFVLARL